MTDPNRDQHVDPTDPELIERDPSDAEPTGLDDTAGDPYASVRGDATSALGDPTPPGITEPVDPTAWAPDPVADPSIGAVPSEDPFVDAAGLSDPVSAADPFDDDASAAGLGDPMTGDPLVADPLTGAPLPGEGAADPFAADAAGDPFAPGGADDPLAASGADDPLAASGADDAFTADAKGPGGLGRPELTPLFAMAGLADLAASVVREIANEQMAAYRARKAKLSDTDPDEVIDEATDKINSGAHDVNAQFNAFVSRAQQRTQELFDQALAQYEQLATRGRSAVNGAMDQAKQQRARAGERVDTTAQERAEDVSEAADRMAERVSRAAQAAADRVSRTAKADEAGAEEKAWDGGGPSGEGSADDNRNI